MSAPLTSRAPAPHPAVAPTRPAQRRHRKALAAVSVVLLAISAAACMSNDGRTFLDRTNALRSSQGVHSLAEQDMLTAKAERWAAHLAATGVLAHSQLSQGVEGLAWRALGENVGVSGPTSDTLLTLYNTLAGSPEHRRNMLDPQFTHLGVGVATGADGRVWVVEVFAAL